MILQSLPIPTVQEIEAAHHRIRHQIQQTPLLESEALNRLTRARLLFKAEVLQKTGAFKVRGAMNFLLQLKEFAPSGRVVAFSSGNHAQAVAYAANQLGFEATIVMPSDAPAVKINSTRRWGASVVLYNRQNECRETIARRIAEEQQATLIPPFDHPWIIAGQGTVALELCEQAQALDTRLDMVLIPCSGGGLTSGCGIVLKEKTPATQLIAMEPEGYDDVARSLKAGSRQAITPRQSSLCDSLMMTAPGVVTFPLLQQSVHEVLTVDDATVCRAMATAFNDLKLVVEPGGATGLGAILASPERFAGKAVCIVLSGGNVDAALFSQILTEQSGLI